jgi:hypothetical protein
MSDALAYAGQCTLNLDMAVNCFRRVSMTDDIGRSGRLAMFRILHILMQKVSNGSGLCVHDVTK